MEFFCAIDKPMKTTPSIPCSYSCWKIINFISKTWKKPTTPNNPNPPKQQIKPLFLCNQSINQSKIMFSLQFSCSYSVAPPSEMTLLDLYFKAKEPEKENLQWISWKRQLFFSYVLQNLSNVVDYFSHLVTSLPFHSFHYNTFKADYIAPEQTVKQET